MWDAVQYVMPSFIVCFLLKALEATLKSFSRELALLRFTSPLMWMANA